MRRGLATAGAAAFQDTPMRLILAILGAFMLAACQLEEPDFYEGPEKEVSDFGPDPADPRPEVQ